jgi:hypothetical protein
MVDCSDIKSQWQAYFSGRFPVDMNSLPETHESDEAFFKSHWQGEKEWHGLPMTYRAFMLIHYPAYWTGKLVVSKKSGKPFKSGLKKGTVRRIVLNPQSPKLLPAYEFIEDGTIVDVCQCQEEAT